MKHGLQFGRPARPFSDGLQLVEDEWVFLALEDYVDADTGRVPVITHFMPR